MSALVTLIPILLDLISLKFERDVILAEVESRKAAGATDEEIVQALRDMRDKAIGDAQAAIDAVRARLSRETNPAG